MRTLSLPRAPHRNDRISPEHTFLGANTVVQDMLMNFGDELGVKPGLDFAGSIARNREFLKTSADVTLSEGRRA